MILSTPNEDLLPHANSGNKFHFKHYTLKETQQLINSSGLEMVSWAGQDVYMMSHDMRPTGLLAETDMALQDSIAGQFNIIAGRKPPASTPRQRS